MRTSSTPGDEEGALDNYHAALQIFESLHAADPTNANVRRFIGVMHERMGAMLALRNDAAGAIAE